MIYVQGPRRPLTKIFKNTLTRATYITNCWYNNVNSIPLRRRMFNCLYVTLMPVLSRNVCAETRKNVARLFPFRTSLCKFCELMYWLYVVLPIIKSLRKILCCLQLWSVWMRSSCACVATVLTTAHWGPCLPTVKTVLFEDTKTNRTVTSWNMAT